MRDNFRVTRTERITVFSNDGRSTPLVEIETDPDSQDARHVRVLPRLKEGGMQELYLTRRLCRALHAALQGEPALGRDR